MKKILVCIVIALAVPAAHAGLSVGLIQAARKKVDTVNGKVVRNHTADSPPPPSADTQAPAIPANLTAVAVSSSQIDLAWTASSDNVGVTGYKIYRNGGVSPIAAPAATTYNDASLGAETAYYYKVSACDLAGNCSAQSTAAVATPPLGISFPLVGTSVMPGLGITQLVFSVQHLQALHSPIVRFSENWKYRETSAGVWNWDPLDQRINAFYNAGIKIMLTIEAFGPTWRCGTSNARTCVFNDLDVFKSYITALVLRYPGKIAKIQFGSEVYTSYWYVGTDSEFIQSANAFYTAVKAAAPALPVVLAGMPTGVPQVYAVCTQGKTYIPTRRSNGALIAEADLPAFCAEALQQSVLSRTAAIVSGASYDIIDVHLYDNVESWPDLRDTLDAMAPGIPVLASEVGGPNKLYESQTDAFHAEKVDAFLRMLPALRLTEAYYFQLVEYDPALNMDHEKSGLLRFSDYSVTPAYTEVQCHNVGAQP